MSESSILETAGEVVAVDSPPGWVTRLLDEASAGALSPRPASATMAIHIEATSRPFSVAGLTPLTRGAWSHADEVVVEDACGSGFDVRLDLSSGCPEFTYRWRPRPTRSVARFLLPSRFHLLAREVLMHYPVLWWASVRGRAPLHAVACTAGDAVTLLAGPGGVASRPCSSSGPPTAAARPATTCALPTANRSGDWWSRCEWLEPMDGGCRMDASRCSSPGAWPNSLPTTS